MKQLTELECRSLSSRMRWIGDIPKIRRETGLCTGLLVAIHTQDLRRYVIRNYWKMKALAPRLAGRWRSGETIERLARKRSFPPIAIARIVASEIGVSKADFRKMVSAVEIEHELPRDHRRLASEVAKAVKRDYMDSPWSLRIYRELGREGERILAEWLEEKDIPFETEKQQKGGLGVPTPDFLFSSPQKIDGVENISWIESKAFFGDLQHIRRHYRRQVSRYEQRYGDGMIVYWYGVSKEAKEQGPIRRFLDPARFEERPGMKRLQEEVPSKLVTGAVKGSDQIS